MPTAPTLGQGGSGLQQSLAKPRSGSVPLTPISGNAARKAVREQDLLAAIGEVRLCLSARKVVDLGQVISSEVDARRQQPMTLISLYMSYRFFS